MDTRFPVSDTGACFGREPETYVEKPVQLEAFERAVERITAS